MRGSGMFLAALVLLLSAVAAAAQGGQHGQATCFDTAVTTVEINACARQALSQAQAGLDARLATVRQQWRQSPETLRALRVAQERWAASRQADVAARFAREEAALARGEQPGTAYTAQRYGYEAGRIRARTEQLCEFLGGPAYGEREPIHCDPPGGARRDEQQPHPPVQKS